MATSIRKAIEESDEAGDAGTADIFTAFSRSLDRSLWFLEAQSRNAAELPAKLENRDRQHAVDRRLYGLYHVVNEGLDLNQHDMRRVRDAHDK
jgi:hypothetical protein